MKNKILKIIIFLNLVFTMINLAVIFISSFYSNILADLILSIILIIISFAYNVFLLKKDIYYSRALFGMVSVLVIIVGYGTLITINWNNSLELSNGIYWVLANALFSLITYSLYYFLDKSNWV